MIRAIERLIEAIQQTSEPRLVWSTGCPSEIMLAGFHLSNVNILKVLSKANSDALGEKFLIRK